MVDISYLGYPARSASWADRSGLLDAPYWPFDGMNERGLAVGMMAVPHARDAAEPGRPTIGSLQAIRLLLDHAANVDEAIALLRRYTISFEGGPPLHYLVADATGHSAVIEYIAGNMVVLYREHPWQVATNFLISVDSPSRANAPCWRYNRAFSSLAQADGSLTCAQAMSVLAEVSQRNTMWSVVYDLTNLRVNVTAGQKYGRIHTFRLGARRNTNWGRP
jgi:choloylglycine hydrolase